MAPFSAIYHNP